jgi:hypothetical protein
MDLHIVNAWAEEYVQLEARIEDLEAQGDTLRTLCALLMEQTARLTCLCRAQHIALDDRSRLDGYYSPTLAAEQHIADVAIGRVVPRRSLLVDDLRASLEHSSNGKTAGGHSPKSDLSERRNYTTKHGTEATMRPILPPRRGTRRRSQPPTALEVRP